MKSGLWSMQTILQQMTGNNNTVFLLFSYHVWRGSLDRKLLWKKSWNSNRQYFQKLSIQKLPAIFELHERMNLLFNEFSLLGFSQKGFFTRCYGSGWFLIIENIDVFSECICMPYCEYREPNKTNVCSAWMRSKMCCIFTVSWNTLHNRFDSFFNFSWISIANI